MQRDLRVGSSFLDFRDFLACCSSRWPTAVEQAGRREYLCRSFGEMFRAVGHPAFQITIGALIVRIRFGARYTIPIIRNPHNSIGNILGSYSIPFRLYFQRLNFWYRMYHREPYRGVAGRAVGGLNTYNKDLRGPI